MWKSSPPFLAILPFGYELLVLEGLATLAGTLGMRRAGQGGIITLQGFLGGLVTGCLLCASLVGIAQSLWLVMHAG